MCNGNKQSEEANNNDGLQGVSKMEGNKGRRKAAETKHRALSLVREHRTRSPVVSTCQLLSSVVLVACCSEVKATAAQLKGTKSIGKMRLLLTNGRSKRRRDGYHEEVHGYCKWVGCLLFFVSKTHKYNEHADESREKAGGELSLLLQQSPVWC